MLAGHAFIRWRRARDLCVIQILEPGEWETANSTGSPEGRCPRPWSVARIGDLLQSSL